MLLTSTKWEKNKTFSHPMEEIEIQRQPDWNPATQQAIKGERRMSPIGMEQERKIESWNGKTEKEETDPSKIETDRRLETDLEKGNGEGDGRQRGRENAELVMRETRERERGTKKKWKLVFNITSIRCNINRWFLVLNQTMISTVLRFISFCASIFVTVFSLFHKFFCPFFLKHAFLSSRFILH